MAFVTPEQLEQEADALMGVINNPPADKPESEVDTPPDTTAADEAASRDADGEPEQTDDSPPEADTDELQGLTVENAAERIRNAQHRMHKATEETAGLRRLNAQIMARAQQAETALAETKTRQADIPPASPDSDQAGKPYADLQALAEDYPNIINPLLSTLKAMSARVESLGGEVGEIKVGTAKTAEESARIARETAEAAHLAAIFKAHPDAGKIRVSDDFEGWLDRQSSMYRYAIERGTAEDVINVLDEYKAVVGGPSRLDKARAVATPPTPRARTQPTSGRPRFTRAQIDAMSPAEFAKHEAEIDAAMARGDIT